MELFTNNCGKKSNKLISGYCYPVDKQQFNNRQTDSLIIYKFHISGSTSINIKYPPNVQEFPNMWIVRR